MTHGIVGVHTAQGIVVRHAPPRGTLHTDPVTSVQQQQLQVVPGQCHCRSGRRRRLSWTLLFLCTQCVLQLNDLQRAETVSESMRHCHTAT